MGVFKNLFDYSSKQIKKMTPIKDAVLALDEKYAAMSDEELQSVTPALKERLANGETLDDILPDAFAACREASWRVLELKPYPVQILGGIVLHNGGIAEMKTGEGKTLVATLPAYLNALSGKGVHIVTVNDYLARRDSEWMGKVYRFLGLSVGLIVNGLDPDQRREAYAADITYGTNNEFGFDYLRDNMVQYKSEKVQRGLNYAIVDEVDSILIDEARTPLIISGQGTESTDLYTLADSFVKTLTMSKVKEVESKQEVEDVGDGDYVVDEKNKTATLTASGVKKAEAFFHVDNLTDADNTTLFHHINQAIRAHGVMHRDIDYVVKDGEVLIVDEFTGRIMLGRRYNEGLHQALEAKEHVRVQRESKTLATITFQNFFRLYSKLSGMTGTAMTEADEFNEIYNLYPVEIPTNKPMIREDRNDVVYKTEKGKFQAVLDEIQAAHAKGQPVLVGTINIEKSERLSRMLKQKGLKHEVLNAKNNEREAEIIAQAGKFGAITIATNMAGRGTDIMLGGNPEFLAKAQLRKLGYSNDTVNEAMGYAETDNKDVLAAREDYAKLLDKFKKQIEPEAEKVREAGGLYIIGTERHESRRIDNQLRGRSGRQGDPGASRFFLSLEDDLIRLFGGDRMTRIMNTLNVDENTPIELKTLTKTIANAQKKVEGENYAIRKHVLQFDDVMNQQRKIIYKQRDEVLDETDLKDNILKMLDETIDNAVAMYLTGDSEEDWDLDGLRSRFLGWILDEDDDLTSMHSTEEISTYLKTKGRGIYDAREEEFGSEVMRNLERMILLRNVDLHWMDHIDAMEQLQDSIGLRAYAQQDPVVAYKYQGSDMFNEMTEEIREDTVHDMLTVQLKKQAPIKRKSVARITSTSGSDEAENGGARKPVKKTQHPGPNDPCWCGSGKKYKKCHMMQDIQEGKV
ncbi:MAG: preprotein translocase subunit SecA [Oscillospiraceae bacterium]|nr:preprotein translocase subunit SecA [Oscillospiraceae bacterium]